MKIMIAALAAATALGVAAPAAVAQPGYWHRHWHHHYWHHGFYGWHGGRRAWCWHHPRAC